MNNPIDDLIRKWGVRFKALQEIDTPNSRVKVHELGMCIEALKWARYQELVQLNGVVSR